MNALVKEIRHNPLLWLLAYGLGMLFSLKTRRELFASAEHEEAGEMVYLIVAMTLYLLPPRAQ